MKRKLELNGRPPKPIGLAKTYKVTIKMSTEEYYTFKAKVRESNLNMSEFVRASIAKSVVREYISSTHLDLFRKLAGMCNNLNQIARKANAQGYNSVSYEVNDLARQIDTIINKIQDDC